MENDEHKNDYMEEEDADQFKTPQVPKKKKKKLISNETENHEEEDGAITIKVKQISEKPDTVAPIVAYFASGYNPYAESDDKVTFYRHKAEMKKRLQVVVSPHGSNVEFVGSNYTGEQSARQTCVYTLGVLDKETNTLKILPIAHNKIFRLEPRVKTVDSEVSVPACEVTELNADNQFDKANKLRSKYGTKKALTQDKKRQALNLGDDPEAQKLLDGKLNEVQIKASALEDTSSIVALNIPPYDASATNPKLAYSIGKIIEKGEWDFLQDIYKLLQEETSVAPESYPVFVRNRMHKLRDYEDETEKQEISVVLSLLTHLIKFKDLNSLNGFASVKDHRFPGIIRQKCKSLFTDSESNRIPVDKAHLLISYVLVLALHVDEFKTDPADIAKDLKMSTVDLRKHFGHLGCKISRGTTGSIATLPVPLNLENKNKQKKRARDIRVFGLFNKSQYFSKTLRI